MDIDIKEIAIRDLRPNNGEVEGVPRNPRKISKKQLEKLKKSLTDAPEMLRLRELVCVEHPDGPVVICGNQRLEAAKALGWKTLPCKVLPADTDPRQAARVRHQGQPAVRRGRLGCHRQRLGHRRAGGVGNGSAKSVGWQPGIRAT